MKKLFCLLFCIAISPFLFSQQIDNKLLNDLKPRSIGPAGMSGRVTAIAVEPDDAKVFYIGTASGGLWKTSNGGVNFKAIFDNHEVSGIGAIAIDPSNPDIVWLGTGEGNPRNSLTGGYGLYKSLDAGRTWKLVGLENTRHIHRIIVHPTNSNILYLGSIGSPWGPHQERGVYKSTDGGKSWKRILFTNEQAGVADMIMDPRNPEKLYVAMWEHLRNPWFFKSGGEGSGLFLTVDGGSNWKQIKESDGLPNGELGRIGLAVSKSDPDFVYALIESKKNAIYRSTDGGYTWKKRGEKNIGNRPFYYADIYVDPINENRLYSLFSYVNISEDGGKTFSTLLGRTIHSDHHAWWIDPKNPNFMIDGNDGGLAITYDRGKSWRHISNLPVSQFYHISVDNEQPYNVYGGMQDNGSWRGPAYKWSRGGIINEYWDFLLGGDGFDVVPVPGDSKFCYAMSQGGNVRRINTETGNSINIKPAEEDIKLRWHWNSAIAQDPFDKNTIYYGSQFVHRSRDRGDSWETISPDLTTNDTSRQLYHKSGGLTYDVTGAETYTCILAIEPSKLEKDVIWVGTDDGNIQITMDGGSSWTNVSSNIKGFPDRPWIPQIVASEHNKGEAYVVVNNYRQNDYAPYLYHTENYGKAWKRIINEEDVQGYALSFIQDPLVPALMFLGTEYGLYISINQGDDWVKWTNSFPTVSTMDLAIQKREADLIIGTFGRSAYVIDDIRPLRAWSKGGADFKNKKVQLFETPTAYMTSRKSAPGYYFHGDSYFKGENRPSGAMISYYVKDGNPKKRGGENSKIELDTALIKILNSEGEIIRHLQQIPDSGINRAYWYYDMDGIKLDFGSRRTSKIKYPGGGGVALAGDYTIRLCFQNDSSDTSLKVLPDPRTNYNPTNRKATQVYLDEVINELEVFNISVIELNKCKKIVKIIDQIAKEQSNDTITETLKQLNKKLANFEKELNGESNVKGIYQNEELFIYKVGPLFSLGYISYPFTQNQKITIELARKELADMKSIIENFLNSEWKDFKKLIEKEGLTFFEDS